MEWAPKPRYQRPPTHQERLAAIQKRWEKKYPAYLWGGGGYEKKFYQAIEDVDFLQKLVRQGFPNGKPLTINVSGNAPGNSAFRSTLPLFRRAGKAL